VLGLVDCFFKPGQTIASYRELEEGREPEDTEGTVEFYDYPLAVLIDRDTASMSEVLAAAIRQHERGILVGETTSGKGVGQRVFPIGSEAELNLVTTEYYFPGTRDSWHQKGIEPDIPIIISEELRVRVQEELGNPLIDLDNQLSFDEVLREAFQALGDSQ
jgi:carboxyl-terminal processing protease